MYLWTGDSRIAATFWGEFFQAIRELPLHLHLVRQTRDISPPTLKTPVKQPGFYTTHLGSHDP
ncbi:hypothetical protein [Laspinema palackyanum]|uniref:hypothetical protein n=1 Tax=Laspinema palackyanum TaxID=3231601 RepID=UPI00345D7CAE|nr:hypothetical protein [Laspinema sp. D2c]